MSLRRTAVLLWWSWFCWLGAAFGQTTYFVGALAGLSTLSADGRSTLVPPSIAVSLYKPENGPALNLLAGVHLNDYFSLQGNYVWNRNGLTLTSTISSRAGAFFYEQSRSSSQHSVVGDVLVYFRNRQSRVRPYLSGGSGLVRLQSRQGRLISMQGSPTLPPAEFASTGPALRVAVGIDVAMGRGWTLRYSFSETIRKNPISERLSPAGQRNLANFQSLFGFVKNF